MACLDGFTFKRVENQRRQRLYTRQHVRTDSSEKLAGEKQTVGENFSAFFLFSDKISIYGDRSGKTM